LRVSDAFLPRVPRAIPQRFGQFRESTILDAAPSHDGERHEACADDQRALKPCTRRVEQKQRQ